MAKHTPGSMDIEAQERTFAAFITWTVRAVITIVTLLLLLALING